MQAKSTEEQRQKERADDAEKERLVKLEYIMREVGQLTMRVEKMEIAYLHVNTAEQEEERNTNPLLEIMTLTVIHFNKLINPVRKLETLYFLVSTPCFV